MNLPASPRTSRSRRVLRNMVRNRQMYFMLIPGLIFFLVYRYVPMYGLIIAFKKFSVGRGIWGSRWIGLENFEDFFLSPVYGMMLRNTLVISLYKLVLCFPAPILLALMLNEVRRVHFRKTVQTVVCLPYFISWVVLGSIALVFFAPKTGVLSAMWQLLFGRPLDVMMNPHKFRGFLVFTEMWKETGWSAIIYTAALTSINYELYEAAHIDGANKWHELRYITMPSIMPTIMTMLILRLGHVLNAGFEQVLILQNSLVYEVSEIIDTYVYKVAFQQGNYGLSAAAGLFKSAIGLALVLVTNKIANRFEQGVF